MSLQPADPKEVRTAARETEGHQLSQLAGASGDAASALQNAVGVVFGEEGPLARAADTFRPREGQTRMAQAVARVVGGVVALSGLYGLLFAAGIAVGRRRGSGSAFGLGDVKLAAVLGAWLAWPGWSALLLGGYLGLVIGGLVALAALATGAAARGSHLPHAPAMALGAWLALCLT